MVLFNSGRSTRSMLNKRWQKEFSQAEQAEISREISHATSDGVFSHRKADFHYIRETDGSIKVIKIVRKRKS